MSIIGSLICLWYPFEHGCKLWKKYPPCSCRSITKQWEKTWSINDCRIRNHTNLNTATTVFKNTKAASKNKRRKKFLSMPQCSVTQAPTAMVPIRQVQLPRKRHRILQPRLHLLHPPRRPISTSKNCPSYIHHHGNRPFSIPTPDDNVFDLDGLKIYPMPTS